MKSHKVSFTLKLLLFLLIGLLLYRTTTVVFLEKTSYPKYRNYKAQESVDILILGSSHSDSGINAGQLESSLSQNDSVNVFNYSIYGMRIEQMYYFMREIMEDKKPKLLVIETFSFLPIEDKHREILARRAFDMFPLSMNKLQAIPYCVIDEYESYYFPIIKYHTRWKELSSSDFTVIYDDTKWSNAGKTNNSLTEAMDEEDLYFQTDVSQINAWESINATEQECLEGILDLAKENNIKILFVSVPFKEQLGMDSLRLIRINRYLEMEYVDDSDVKMLDMNRMWKELDFGYHDLYNAGHCNEYGAEKVTNCLADYLIDTYDMVSWEVDRNGI